MAQINLKETTFSEIETPAAGYVALAVKDDGTFIGKNSTGTEVGVGFSGDYDDLTNKPSGITSSFQIDFTEFIIENGIITQENEIWAYEGVLTVGINTNDGAGRYIYGYQLSHGSILPTSTELKGLSWSEETGQLTITIKSSLTKMGNLIIDEGEIGEFSFEGADFIINAEIATTNTTTTNPFPIEAGTHTIKLQYK